MKNKETKEVLKVPSVISKITTMSDGGLRLQVDTQEIASEDAGKVMLLRNKIGVFVFADADIKEEDVKDLPEIKLEEKEKSPSTRLRSVLFLLWDQGKKTEEPFEIYYRRTMEKFIDTVKEKLN